MKNIVIYVHGKGGSAAEAEHYRQLFPDSEVIGFDYHAQTPWEAKEEFPEFFAQQRKHCDRLTLVANSIGAFFSLSSLDGALVDSACLISPVVDMEKLIENMMLWADVTEQELAEKLEIPTDFGETLSWKYLCYVREHPIHDWHCPICILYAGQDNMTSRQTVEEFTRHHGAQLTIMDNGEHWFHTPEQRKVLQTWEEAHT